MKYYSVIERNPPQDEPVWGYDCYYDGWVICQWVRWSQRLENTKTDDCFITHWARIKYPKEPTKEEIETVVDYEQHKHISCSAK